MKSLYVHIPFCDQKCFYCSFVVSIAQEHRMDLYLECLEREAQAFQGSEINTIYIGGGTPTLLSETQLAKLFTVIQMSFSLQANVEWTIEANPERLSVSKLRLIKNSGVNRISLGIQSLNNKYLKYLGRNHSAESAMSSYQMMRQVGFSNVNVDLMFSFPNQTMDELEKDVGLMSKLGSDHVSLYALSVEQNSRFYAQNIPQMDDLDQAKQYTRVCDVLSANGFEQYEISNFAKLSKASRHNLNYWTGGRYIGLGVGAHSYLNGKRAWNVSRLNDYVSLLQKGESVEEGREELSNNDQMKEVLLFGLRMNCGVNVDRIKQQFGCFLEDAEREKISELIQGGFLIQEGAILKVSTKGRLVLDELCSQLI